jgi:hypothetical protein
MIPGFAANTRVLVSKVILIVIDGMDTVNFTMAHTPAMSGLHGRTAVGIAHTEIIGAGAPITPIAHAMMGTGRNVIAHRPGPHSSGRPVDYYGHYAETIGDIARRHGLETAAIGKNEAAIVLGGLDSLDYSFVERDGIDALDDQQITDRTVDVLSQMDRGIVVLNYNGVDDAGHRRDIGALIRTVENADRLVTRILAEVDPDETLMLITSDHGTNPVTGNHSTAPTPFCLITGQIPGRVNLGIVHNIEIAVTIAAALGLPAPELALGRDLVKVALEINAERSYRSTIERQIRASLASEPSRRQMIALARG